jgi:beta-galactosidase
MKKGLVLVLLFTFIISSTIFSQDQSAAVARERLLMDYGWRFAFGHPFDTHKDFDHGTGYFSYLAKAGYADGAAAANFDDRGWRKLDLPHDWAVEQPFDSKASFSHGFKAIGRNFPDASVGWYRKKFAVPATDLGRRIAVVFDGVFRNSKVWVNGHYLGTEQSGYNNFEYDISDYLNYGGSNVIAVRVDVTMEEGWFYEGAGIYRHVWLTKTMPLHVSFNGTYVTTQVQDNNNAVVTAQATIINEAKSGKNFTVVQTIVDANGKSVAASAKSNLHLKPFEVQEYALTLSVTKARLWDLEDPYLYKLITEIKDGAEVIDSYETNFGIRSIRFDAKEGFFLNNKNVKLHGTNNHQDHAGVGSAMPDALQYFRIKQLKEMGVNAYRCSHNPPTPELLEACDKLGVLVIDENRLMGINAMHLDDVKSMMIRDRNHPSIFCWSAGNEEWAIENNETGERITQTMETFIKSIDTTRQVTVAISGGFRSGISSVVEIMGYNYLGNGDIDAHQKRFPQQPGMGTEEGSTFATRGIYFTDDAKHYKAAYDKKPRPSFYSIEEAWKFYSQRPYLAGMFIWTGFDYRGEATPYDWPSVYSYFGMLDACGFPKDNKYYLKSWWSNEPTLHILPHWTWPGMEGKEIDVWIYSNCEEVELFLNNKSLGKKKMELNGHLEWKVKYAAGILEAAGYKAGKKILTDVQKTTGSPVAVQLTPDKIVPLAGRQDISVVTAEVLDKNKLHIPTAGNEISFSIQGPGKIIGVGNGDPASLEKDKYIETIQSVPVINLKEKEVTTTDDLAETAADYNDASWKDAYTGRDYKNLAKYYVYRGSFILPENFSGSDITFFYKQIGIEQSLYINGIALVKNIKENAEFRLDKSLLKAGKNNLTIVATPIGKKYDWDFVNTDPGAVQIFTPPATWKRKLFNGLAQIIVQSTGEAGEIVLTANAGDLQPGILKIQSNPVQSGSVVKQSK